MIISKVNEVEDFAAIKKITKEEALRKGLLFNIGEDLDDKYISTLKQLVLNADLLNKYAKEIKIVYTPLNGAGNLLVRRVLEELGFENVWIVPEQVVIYRKYERTFDCRI